MKKIMFSLIATCYTIVAFACSCLPPGKIDEEQFRYYDFIAKGEVVRTETTSRHLRFWLRVSDLYKGDTAGEVMISTARSSAACGIGARKGETWLIYARKHDDTLSTNSCTRSLPLKSPGMSDIPERAKEDLKFLEKKIGAAGETETEVYSIGVIDRLYSEKLAEERRLNIYLPKGYKDSASVSYPVIYLLDGSADEDFEHVTGLLQFSNFSWLNYMPKAIIVGIANTDRTRDFTFPTTDKEFKKEYPQSGGSAAFIDFIQTELKPYVESKYRANQTDMLIGQSLGGLLASEILYTKPELFEHYFIVSPSLWYSNSGLLEQEPAFLKPTFEKKTTVYIAVGNEGKTMKNVARKLAHQVKKCPYIKMEHRYFEDEDHAGILHPALYEGFKGFRKRAGMEVRTP